MRTQGTAVQGTIRERGQVTIPASVRAEAGLAEGTVVDFEIRADGVLIRPLLVVDDVAVDEEFVREMIASTTLGFAELRDDPGAWQEELDERRLLEGTLRDGLDGE